MRLTDRGKLNIIIVIVVILFAMECTSQSITLGLGAKDPLDIQLRINVNNKEATEYGIVSEYYNKENYLKVSLFHNWMVYDVRETYETKGYFQFLAGAELGFMYRTVEFPTFSYNVGLNAITRYVFTERIALEFEYGLNTIENWKVQGTIYANVTYKFRRQRYHWKRTRRRM